MGMPDVVGLLEACYQTEVDEAGWLAGIAEAAAPLFDRGLGVAAFTYRRVGLVPRIADMHLSPSFDPRWLQAFEKAAPAEPLPGPGAAPCGWRTWMHRSSGTVSTIEGMEGVVDALSAFGGARDVLAVNGYDPTLRGVWLGAPLPRKQKLGAARARLLSRIATHLAAASRLRRRLAAVPTEEPEAVLAPDGKVVHAEGVATGNEERVHLRDAVRSLDRSRSANGRRDEETATRGWRGLVSARWTLLDQFSRDGRRYVVAVRNDVDETRPVVLSDRERQALAFAAVGQTDKEIAYTLGLSEATVRVLFHRAARKLGCSGKAQLLARYAELATAQ